MTVVQSAFATVLWVVCGLSIVVALVTLAFSGRTWQELGKDHLLMDRDTNHGPRPGSIGAQLERDLEIRQMLEARNRRRARRGEAPIDVELELQRLTAPAIDGELREEIRQLVIARNHRRERRGKPPLDVDAEIEREILSLHGI
jgi:hypothetical protein